MLIPPPPLLNPFSYRMVSAAFKQEPRNATAANTLAQYYLTKWFEVPGLTATATPGLRIIRADGPRSFHEAGEFILMMIVVIIIIIIIIIIVVVVVVLLLLPAHASPLLSGRAGLQMGDMVRLGDRLHCQVTHPPSGHELQLQVTHLSGLRAIIIIIITIIIIIIITGPEPSYPHTGEHIRTCNLDRR
jgi:hypothetical protein